MFQEKEYVVYRREVCQVEGIKENHLNHQDYYILRSLNDPSLVIDVPVENRCGYLRSIVTKEEIEALLQKIPTIPVITCQDRFIDQEYRTLLHSGNHEDLIRIIKTTYLRNQQRLMQKRRVGDKDRHYFEQAENYLYQEFCVVLGLSLDETRDYIVQKVQQLEGL